MVKLASLLLNKNGRIAIEWPQNCDYWAYDEVQSFIQKWNLKTCIFHGCMYGLVAQRKSCQGIPIKKPWKIVTNCEQIRKRMCITCDRSHEHARCEGVDTRRTEQYTDQMVSTIQDGFAEYLEQKNGDSKPACYASSGSIFPQSQLAFDLAVPCVPENHPSCIRNHLCSAGQRAQKLC